MRRKKTKPMDSTPPATDWLADIDPTSWESIETQSTDSYSWDAPLPPVRESSTTDSWWLDDQPTSATYRQTESTAPKSLVERIKESLKHKITRRLGASALALAIIVPVGAKTIDAVTPENAQASSSISTVYTPNITPFTPTPETVAVFEETAAEECGEDVAYRAAQIYDELFTQPLPTAENITALDAIANQAIVDFEYASSMVEFHTLPAKYKELYSDAESFDPQIPIATYEQFLADYLANTGIRPVFEWKPAKDVSESVDTDTPDELGGLPLSKADRESSTILRRAILGFADAISSTPIIQLDTSAPKYVYFADLSVTENFRAGGYVPMGSFLGLPTSGGDYMVMNANALGEPSSINFSEVTSHEFAHIDHIRLLGACLSGSFTNNNPTGFEYGQATYDTLSEDKTVAGYSTIESNDRDESDIEPAATASAYGASSIYEDVATIAELLNPQSTQELFIASSENEVVYHKLAIYIAQMKDESLRNYLVSYLKVARIYNHVGVMSSQFENQSPDNNYDKYTDIISNLRKVIPNNYPY